MMTSTLEPGVLPGIELGELVDLDAPIPCHGLWTGEPPCPVPATWRYTMTCVRCGRTDTYHFCDGHRAQVVVIAAMERTKCCGVASMDRWTRL